MAQFDRFTEINKEIRDVLVQYSEINDACEGRIFYYRPSLPEGKEPPLPFIFFRRAGGIYGEYRYLFRIRAATAESLEILRRAVLRRLHSPMNFPNNENIVDVRMDGMPSDGGDETTGWYESNFYVVFELLEAQYT